MSVVTAEWAPATRHRFDLDRAIPLDRLGRRWCTCGVVEGSARHWRPPDPSEARRLGEREDDLDDDDGEDR